MNSVEIIGTGSYVPEKIVTNEDMSKIVDTSDEWISSRTGIKERRISINENTSDLGAKAALRAIEDSNIKPEEIDLIIVATTSPDSYTPSVACIVQEKIGAKNAACFDLNAACTGFIFALNTASQFIKTGEYKTALVVGTEVLSKILDWQDRGTCVLFGDGAGAVIIRGGDENGIIKACLGSDGTGKDFLHCPATNVINPFSDEKGLASSKISMNGREVFKFAVKVMVSSVKKVIEDSGLNIEDIDYIVPHQANIRIIEFAAKKLGLSMDKFFINLQNYGNTSGATIPLAIDEMNKKGLLKRGAKIVVVGFGGGLTWGSMVLKWTK
ncbi:3-oxoacyl-[acyl-carrier-protein] synthase-3 [Clostridium acetobutylicum]|uniref:Beta-ketoacyl-[acyl-carrier-protein] synthase III n=1 Tax=Clostridium acetobutylicum (strain ATCC 824 / DSM 792 / JCM 1419 / IAM 19013 / LMG 5710 / NBRC 13948 / NRRL B-527 / VKM B-1787 / 2291 / W) TaxID=272562 RepID=FABH_CLOAB|nr:MULTISPECIES: beta-ketoacyl-ACP synthase III [Clostridium]Q97DA2.1 RecName: Full=Beta-ketoacyl-[acyl-carrier-protein] synthase III; Short=Beta-ketoacyl-ACP synthase III; Short=KAS III; AltName: Full=3-oxoacyl-[acyl-carrier-protein] synthase 3; AltName: Full=3-oxoacyl-[acyl-carrier-protein] synthase III [Clostridium acetobutylicum ATCC 824]AAK81501.1 3-oxoacyl-[acyl-carrier-protein] synthase III [Clostridium acetobutylicum ATCC 824]ADZ22622.1 3-oxoacyl-(acyl carrier protein) synthase III [Clos